jgi:hypothetical protein
MVILNKTGVDNNVNSGFLSSEKRAIMLLSNKAFPKKNAQVREVNLKELT